MILLSSRPFCSNSAGNRGSLTMSGGQNNFEYRLQRENTRLQTEEKTTQRWLNHLDFSKFVYFAKVGRVRSLPHYSDPPPHGKLRRDLLPHVKECHGGIEFLLRAVTQSSSYQSAKTHQDTWVNIWCDGSVNGSKRDKYVKIRAIDHRTLFKIYQKYNIPFVDPRLVHSAAALRSSPKAEDKIIPANEP